MCIIKKGVFIKCYIINRVTKDMKGREVKKVIPANRVPMVFRGFPVNMAKTARKEKKVHYCNGISKMNFVVNKIRLLTLMYLVQTNLIYTFLF